MPENNNAGHGAKPQVAGGYDARRPLLESPLKPLVNQLDPQQPEEGAVKADEAVEAELDEAALFTVPPMAVKIGKEIGKGAFSVVYAGEYRRAAVAVKCQPKDAEGRIPPFVLREVQVLSRLRHPRLLQFVGAADHAKAKQVWILSEFSNNGDVDQLLRAVRKGTQPHPGWEALVRVALDAADGLHFLQSLHILHRDIKSSNILLDAKLRAKLCDFGFATDLVPFSTDAVSSMTADMGDAGASGAVRRKSYCGTDAYMAPEMFLDEDYDERVDVFSFGVVLMEMLCCRTANADGFLLRLPQNKFRIALSEFQDALPVSCPPVLARLAERCVAFEPRDRPSIDEVVRTLRELVDDRENVSALAAVVELRQFVPAELEPQIVEDDEYYGENDDDDEGDDDDDDDDDDEEDEEDEDDTLVRSDTIDLDADVEGRDIVSQRVDEPFLDDVDEDEGEDKLQPLQQIPATPAPYHAGVILKRGRRGNRTWTEKWFILDHDHLHYTDMPQPSRGPNARRQSNYVPPISSLSLRECRIWKTMEMPELRFNVIDSNWKIKRELQALNKADLEAWMDLINQGIDYANELYASERDVHTSDASTQPNNSNGSTNSRPSREKKHMQLQFEQQQQQRQQQKQERERQQASKSKVAVVRKARRSGSDAALLEEYQETLADLDDEVYLWLKELGYQKYISTLRAKGFSSIDFIRETGIEKEDLNFLGIRESGARRALTAAARALRNEE